MGRLAARKTPNKAKIKAVMIYPIESGPSKDLYLASSNQRAEEMLP
jgi:hypothetical protein